METPYDPKIERLMKQYFSRLPEKERRHYAAIEAQKLGFGGKVYISKLMPINRHALNKGIKELLVFTHYAIIKERIESTTTSTGLRVIVRPNLGVYEKGIKVDKAISQHKRIRYHPTLPSLNYRISPG